MLPGTTRTFDAAAGTGKDAYAALDRLFSGNGPDSFMTLENRYQTLLVRTWMPDTPAERAAAMIAAMENIRRRQISLLGSTVKDGRGHECEIEDLFARAHAGIDKLNEWERGNLRVMENHCLYLSAFKADPGLTDRYIGTLRDSSAEWLASLDEDTPAAAWALHGPAFERAFAVLKDSMKEPARLLSERLGRPVPLSEAALMQLNPGITSRDVAKSLEALKSRYRSLIAGVRAQIDSGTAPGLYEISEIPPGVQLRIFSRISQGILKGAGHSPETLARDGVQTAFSTSQTGVCWGHSKNILLSVESVADDLTVGLCNTWHETGHMLYLLDMNRLPPAMQGKPVATFNGFGAHEAAAMTMEQAGMRRRAFQLMEPVIRDELNKAKAEGLLAADFDTESPALSAENLYRHANRPDLTAMEWGSSELSLAPNMSWRIKAFQMIFDGDLEVGDLPRFWAQDMEEWTGIPHDPADFQIGEDHIFSGLGGYFWAYMTGAFTATALHEEIVRTKAAPDTAATDIASYSAGYSSILRERIFKHASKDEPDVLFKRAAGYSLSSANVINAYMNRLAAAAQDGMPAPDEVLARQFSAPARHRAASTPAAHAAMKKPFP